jgi:hypothetical protein
VEMVKGCEKKNIQAKELLEQVQKWYEKHANKTWRHVEFEVGQHVWLNIRDFKMPNGLAPCFIAKYARFYETFHKPHLDMYTLKLPTNFVAHSTFHVSKLKLFLWDDQRLTEAKGVARSGCHRTQINHWNQRHTPCKTNML